MREIDIITSLRELEDERGRLTPAALVAAASAVTHPLHAAFEWDDKKAAARDRLNTARSIIKSVEVRLTVNKHQIRSVAYVRDPAMPGNVQGYRAVAHVRTDADDSRAATVAEIARAAAHLRRARDLATALNMGGEVEAVLVQMSAVTARIKQQDTAGQA